MAKWGNVNFKELEAFSKKLEKTAADSEAFAVACLKEMAARLLAKVIKRTPVGKYHGAVKRYKRDNTKKGVKKGDAMKTKSGKPRYHAHPSGKTGGTLRRGWTASSEGAAKSGGAMDASAYLDSVSVSKKGNLFSITIENPVHYASYVENGHRTRGGGWVEGKFMLRISENQLRAEAPAILEKKLEVMIREALGQ